MNTYLDRLRAHCMAKLGVVEDYPWGDTVWKVNGKMFAAGGETSVTVKSTVEKQSILIQQPNIEKAAYVGRFGWVTVTVANDADLELAFDLIDESYEMVSSKSKKKPKSYTMDEEPI